MASTTASPGRTPASRIRVAAVATSVRAGGQRRDRGTTRSRGRSGRSRPRGRGEGIGGTGHRDGEPPARRVDHGVVRRDRRPSAGRCPPWRRAAGRGGEAGVRQPRDGRAARPHTRHPAVADAHHGAPADTDVRTSRGAQVGGLAEDGGRRTATLPRRTTTDVGRRASGFRTRLRYRSCISAPATPAAGPTGPSGAVGGASRRAITPPSQRITIRGAVTLACDGGVDEVGGWPACGAGSPRCPRRGGCVCAARTASDLRAPRSSAARRACRVQDAPARPGAVDAERLAGDEDLSA